jgi:hypothetical protein
MTLEVLDAQIAVLGTTCSVGKIMAGVPNLPVLLARKKLNK